MPCKMENKHTPLPWKYSLNVGPTKAIIMETDGSTILELSNHLRIPLVFTITM